MPLSTKSGRSGISASTASITQSVGVPSTCQRRSPRCDRPQRMVQRQRMARRALLAIGRDDGHLAQRLGRGDEALEPVGQNAVVVGGEEPHPRS